MGGEWIRKPTGSLSVVFVHGILSSGEACWRHANGAYWPDLLNNEPELDALGIYVYTYQTSISSGSYSISDIVDNLKEHIFTLDHVADSKKIVFVCHSMGGIVVRKLIVERVNDFLDRNIEVGLFLVASPSLGSDYANWLEPIAKFAGHAQAKALRFSQDNQWLNDLDKSFINLKESKRLKINGKELLEDKFVTLKFIIRKQVVPPFTGAKYFGESFKVSGSDHCSIAKPEDNSAEQHRLLIAFLAKINSDDTQINRNISPKPISNNSTRSSNNSNTFDVFLCHNSEDKPEIRRIADDLIKEGIKPWLDEREIKPGELWESALENQISTIKSATVFVGESGIGPWQSIEMRAFINEFVERKCPVIPAILASAKTTPPLPILLKSLQYVDFHLSNPDPIKQLMWGITGEKPKIYTLLGGETNDAPALLPEKPKQAIEIRLPDNLESFSANDKEKFLSALSNLLQIDGELKITATRPGSTRIFLELTPEDADKVYAAAQSGQLDSLGITQARLYPSLTYPPNDEQRAQLLILLNRVQEFWIDGVLKQSLHHEVLISLGKRAMDEAVEPPWNRTVDLPKQRNQLSLSNNRTETVFDATGLLLILGEPGSGKTTTLLELADTLIQRAQTDAKERIPIVLNLSSWSKQQTVTEWMADRLSNIYSVPTNLALNWLDKGYLIPLLDGLDEVKTEQQADCVAAINAYITQAEPAGLVVCCRLMEYLWLPEHLKLNGAICIEPLNREQIGQYFTAIGPEFDSLRMAIKEDTVLQELAQSPLMLNIMSMAFQSTPIENISTDDKSLETRRTKIFETYVDKMFQRKARLDKTFPKEKVVNWLSWLARKMTEQSQSIFLIENLQPGWLDSWKQRLAYRSFASLTFGLLFSVTYSLPGLEVGLVLFLKIWSFSGLILALAIGLAFRTDSPIKNAIIFVSVFNLTIVLILWLIDKKLDLTLLLISSIFLVVFTRFGIGTLKTVKTIETLSWSRKSFIEKFSKGFIYCGLLIGLLYGVIIGEWVEMGQREYVQSGVSLFGGGLIGKLSFWVLNTLFGGFFGGMYLGITGGFIDKTRDDKALPNQGITLTLKNGIFAALVPTLFLGLIGGLMGGLMLGKFIEGLAFGLFGGAFYGLFVGLNLGLSAIIKHYSLRLALLLSGKTSFKFIPFLDYCSKLILLKKVGGGYIFIHRMLLEYFANLGSADNKPSKL